MMSFWARLLFRVSVSHSNNIRAPFASISGGVCVCVCFFTALRGQGFFWPALTLWHTADSYTIIDSQHLPHSLNKMCPASFKMSTLKKYYDLNSTAKGKRMKALPLESLKHDLVSFCMMERRQTKNIIFKINCRWVVWMSGRFTQPVKAVCMCCSKLQNASDSGG